MKDLLIGIIIIGPIGFTILYFVANYLFKNSLLFKIAMATGIPLVIMNLLTNLSSG